MRKEIYKDVRGHFFFWDETWTELFGPYLTEIEAEAGWIRFKREYLDMKKTPAISWHKTVKSIKT